MILFEETPKERPGQMSCHSYPNPNLIKNGGTWVSALFGGKSLIHKKLATFFWHNLKSQLFVKQQ